MPSARVIADWLFDQLYGLWISLFPPRDAEELAASPAALRRVAYDPGSQSFAPVAWPHDPPVCDGPPKPTRTLPATDVLVITWTAAEGRALSDVLTPAAPLGLWAAYTDGFASFLPELTRRSPARAAKRLGSWAQLTIGGRNVTCFKSELHPATDGSSMPAARLVAKLVAEARPSLVITTGTAGAVGKGVSLGDVNVATAIRSDFTTRLAGHPWSRMAWLCQPLGKGAQANLAQLAAITPATVRLPSGAGAPKAWSGEVVSTDFFAFGTSDDHFGLLAYDPAVEVVEMDDAAVALGTAQAGLGTPVLSVRNASDPVMDGYSEATASRAEEVYRRYGYWTAVNSAIACWAVIAGMS